MYYYTVYTQSYVQTLVCFTQKCVCIYRNINTNMYTLTHLHTGTATHTHTHTHRCCICPADQHHKCIKIHQTTSHPSCLPICRRSQCLHSPQSAGCSGHWRGIRVRWPSRGSDSCIPEPQSSPDVSNLLDLLALVCSTRSFLSPINCNNTHFTVCKQDINQSILTNTYNDYMLQAPPRGETTDGWLPCYRGLN